MSANAGVLGTRLVWKDVARAEGISAAFLRKGKGWCRMTTVQESVAPEILGRRAHVFPRFSVEGGSAHAVPVQRTGNVLACVRQSGLFARITCSPQLRVPESDGPDIVLLRLARVECERFVIDAVLDVKRVGFQVADAWEGMAFLAHVLHGTPMGLGSRVYLLGSVCRKDGIPPARAWYLFMEKTPEGWELGEVEIEGQTHVYTGEYVLVRDP